MQAKRGKGIPLTLVVTALITLAADQLSKAAVRLHLPLGETVDLAVFRLQQVRNPGTAFGIISVRSWPLYIASMAVFCLLVLLLWWLGRPGTTSFQAGLGLIVGGAAGNIIDRIALGAVVDFIDFRIWPVFNIADLAIVTGVVITMIIVIRDAWSKDTEGA